MVAFPECATASSSVSLTHSVLVPGWNNCSYAGAAAHQWCCLVRNIFEEYLGHQDFWACDSFPVEFLSAIFVVVVVARTHNGYGSRKGDNG